MATDFITLSKTLPSPDPSYATLYAYVTSPLFRGKSAQEQQDIITKALNAKAGTDVPTSDQMSDFSGQGTLYKYGPLLVGGGILAGGGLAAGGGGAAAAGQTPSEWAAGSTTVGGASSAAPAVAGGSRLLNVASRLAPVLGGAASSLGKAERQNEALDLQSAQLGLAAPRTRLATALRAALASAPPVTASWGGPGSGLRGEVPTYSGGAQAAMQNPDVRKLSQQIIHDELMNQMTGNDLPKVGSKKPDSWLDDVLGYGSTVAGIAGAFK